MASGLIERELGIPRVTREWLEEAEGRHGAHAADDDASKTMRCQCCAAVICFNML